MSKEMLVLKKKELEELIASSEVARTQFAEIDRIDESIENYKRAIKSLKHQKDDIQHKMSLMCPEWEDIVRIRFEIKQIKNDIKLKKKMRKALSAVE